MCAFSENTKKKYKKIKKKQIHLHFDLVLFFFVLQLLMPGQSTSMSYRRHFAISDDSVAAIESVTYDKCLLVTLP
jgi:hypothetical protein